MTIWIAWALVACKPETSAPADDCAPGRAFDDCRVLVVPTGRGLELVRSDGTTAWSETWTELVGPCDGCGGEGSSADGDGLLVSFTTDLQADGGIARIDSTGALDFRVDGFSFPHDAVRDPADGSIAIPEATGDRITWIAGDGSSPDPIRALDQSTDGWPPASLPNGVDRFDHAGRSWLVSSHRGVSTGGPGLPGEPGPTGEITMWDITDPARPALAWTYPPGGSLNTPHGAVFREYDGRWWLLYAHSLGAGETSTVGLAVTDDPAERPEYVADLAPGDPVGPLRFLRGVELTDDGQLWLTDSGVPDGVPDGEGTGRIATAPMPSLEPTGASGAVGGGQVFVDLDGASVVVDGLDDPFEGWLWRPTFPEDP